MGVNPFVLLRDLADAIGSAHTRRATARHAAEAISRHLELRRLELGWTEPGSPARIAVFDPVERLYGRELTVLAAGEAVEAALRTRDVQRLRRRTGLGLVIPLLHEELPPCWATIELARDPGAALGRRPVEALARLLVMALMNVIVLERVAALSRRAHVESEDLRRRLEKFLQPETIVAP